MTFSARRVLILCIAAATVQCSYAEVVTASYASRSEARASGAIDRGWIPAWLPESAEDIREAHDLDSNRRWGLFNFAPADGEGIRAALRPEPTPLNGVRCDMPTRVEWWPRQLRGEIDPVRVKDAALEAYRTRADNLVVLVNWKQGRAYYWSE